MTKKHHKRQIFYKLHTKSTGTAIVTTLMMTICVSKYTNALSKQPWNMVKWYDDNNIGGMEGCQYRVLGKNTSCWHTLHEIPLFYIKSVKLYINVKWSIWLWAVKPIHQKKVQRYRSKLLFYIFVSSFSGLPHTVVCRAGLSLYVRKTKGGP